MTAVTADSPVLFATPIPLASKPPFGGADKPGDLFVTCIVCGTVFTAKRASAQCCSGKCRIGLSRTRRVADVTAKLMGAEQAMVLATEALRELRELVQAGAGKLAP